MTRQRWTDLSGTWRFVYDDTDRGLSERWFDSSPELFDRTIEVPYPPESKLSGIQDPSFHPILWYRREFHADLQPGERLLLHFGAVDYRAAVWVNGQKVGEHEGGHTSFSFDVTDALSPAAGPHVLVVRAEDEPADTAQPRGKQMWGEEPSGIWYDRTSGIWQPVWLEPVPAAHIAELVVSPVLDDGTADVEVVINGARDVTGTVAVTLTLDDVVYAAGTTPVESSLEGTTARLRLPMPALRDGHHRHFLWTPESPTLFDVTAELRADDEVDQVSGYAGFRDIDVRDGVFTLNGAPHFLRMVLEQGFWPESHLAAPSDDALRREVELIKDLGFTGVRIHQKIEDPRFLYWCDRLGLIVWGEMANAHEFSATAADRLTREWLDAVRRDRGHPSIVAWVPLNESWGVPNLATSQRQRHYARGLYHLTKAIDPTRLVIANDGWEHTETDVLSVHDYSPQASGLRERYGDAEAVRQTLAGPGPAGRKLILEDDGRGAGPLMITEYGGLSYVPASGEKWFGYRVVDTADEFRDAFAELTTALLDSGEVAGFCYTQLTDTMQERNGLLTENREPKLPLEVVRDIVRQPSRAIPHELVDEQRRRARSAAGRAN